MKKKVKLKGRLKNYILSPVLLTILLVLINIPMYFYRVDAGLAVSFFVVVYFIIVFTNYQKKKPLFADEIIDFATQYGTVQKKLLNELDIAYALLDYNGKIMWLNEKFAEVTGKEKDYHKSVTSLFSHITKEKYVAAAY